MFDVGRSKRAQRAFAFDDITIVPSRRTRGEEEVSLQWRIDAYTFAFPVLAAPMDSVMSPATAIKIGQLGGLGVLNLEGLWTRYDDSRPTLQDHRDRGSDRGNPANAAGLRRADQAGAHRQAGCADSRSWSADCRCALATEHPGVCASGGGFGR